MRRLTFLFVPLCLFFFNALATLTFAQSVRVPGTNVTLVPPDGFSPAREYPGFERPEVRASIMVTELPVPASDMIRSMTVPALATKGMTLISASDVTINDRPARLLNVRQKTTAGEFLKWMLIAGDVKTTFMLVGMFDESLAAGAGDAIKRSLLTTTWGTAGRSGPFEGLPFRVTPTARLKLANRVSNMLMFTESGTSGKPGSTEALFLAGHSIGKGRIEDVQSFAETRATQTTLTKNVANFRGRHVQVAGLDGYELEADATDARSGRSMRLYQVILLDGTGYFILQGLCLADQATEVVPEFKALTGSFRMVAR